MSEQTYTPPPVKGYRKLTQTEVDLMNRGKDIGKLLDEYIDSIQAHVRLTRATTTLSPDEEPTVENFDTLERLAQAEPGRWLSMGRTDMQRGLMCLIRSIAQPLGF